MKIYKYSDTANEYVGFTLHVPGELIVYMRWESPDPYNFKFGKYYETKFYTRESEGDLAWDDMNREIEEKRTDYGKWIDIPKGDEHLMIKAIRREKELINNQPPHIKRLFIRGIL